MLFFPSLEWYLRSFASRRIQEKLFYRVLSARQFLDSDTGENSTGDRQASMSRAEEETSKPVSGVKLSDGILTRTQAISAGSRQACVLCCSESTDSMLF